MWNLEKQAQVVNFTILVDTFPFTNKVHKFLENKVGDQLWGLTYFLQPSVDGVETFWIVIKFALNCTQIENFDDVMSDPHPHVLPHLSFATQ